MTEKEHIEKHKLLHNHLDELLADWIGHTELPVLKRPVCDLINWSYKQTRNPESLQDKK